MPFPAAPTRRLYPTRTRCSAPAHAALAGGTCDRRVRARMLLGGREAVLADAGRVLDRRRLRRRVHAEPDVRRGVRGRTGHAEVVLVVFDPPSSATSSCSRCSGRTTTRPRACARATTSGTQYRSAIYFTDDAQREAAESSREMFQGAGRRRLRRDHDRDEPLRRLLLRRAVPPAVPRKNPNGYCGIGGTGVSCPVGLVSLNPSSSGRDQCKETR